MSGDTPTGAIAGVAIVLAVCCGLHALLLLVGGLTLVGLSLRSWTLAFGGLIILVLAVVWFRRHRCPVSGDRPGRPFRTEGS
jgi:hypothetical protein